VSESSSYDTNEMNTSDLIELWVLNELVVEPSRCSFSRFISDGQKQSMPYWAFPDQVASTATPEERCEAVRNCLDQGWLRAYPKSWSHQQQFSPWPTVVTDHFQVSNKQLLEHTEVTLTSEGNLKWEAEFEPDWRRFWAVLSNHKKVNSSQTVLHVVYAGDEILNELLQWLPSYLQFDEENGLKAISCHTVFWYRATLWKMLPCAKVIALQGEDSDTAVKKAIPKDTPIDLPYDHDVKRQAREEVARQVQARNERFRQAQQILTRLSKRW
jgi:hypothetical protein